MLRRTGVGGAADTGRLIFADLELDEDTHEVRRGGTPIDLSPTEFKLLRYLMLNPDRVLSKAQILDHVWALRLQRRGRASSSPTSPTCAARSTPSSRR